MAFYFEYIGHIVTGSFKISDSPIKLNNQDYQNLIKILEFLDLISIVWYIKLTFIYTFI